MTISIERTGSTFFAEVTGVDLRATLSDADFNAIHHALLNHAVLAFPDQHLDDAQQEAFSRRFGPLEVTFEDPDLYTARLGNIGYRGERRDENDRSAAFLRANQQWHSDSTIFQAPARISFLVAHAVPASGGETQWADMHAAWLALPESRRTELRPLILEHDFQNSRRKTSYEFDSSDRERWPPILHPLVRVHEETGAEALYVGSQATRVIGWPDDDGRALIEELIAFATQDRFVQTHHWRVGDLVMWDNRRVNHRGRPWDESRYARDVRRTTVKGVVPTMLGDIPVNEYAYAHGTAQAV